MLAFVLVWPILIAMLQVQPASAKEPRPAVIRAEPGTTPPVGYHAEEQMRLSLVIAGGIATGFGSLLVAEAAAQQRRERARPRDVEGSAGYVFFYIFGVLHIGAGVPMLATGLLHKKEVYVRDDAQLQVTPVIGSRFTGGALKLRF